MNSLREMKSNASGRGGEGKNQIRPRSSDGFVMDLFKIHKEMKKDLKPSEKPISKPFNLAMDIFRRS
jgi:hypothetical protein